ncbi:MAG: hypothetical protein L0Y74_02595, partial [candidate division Zixibacteria bacterium]|nr:hypothetical protein [candidate division Zixibacteria bacterium]
MKFARLVSSIIILALCVSIQAAVPPLINFQGLLTDTSGAPVDDGNYSVTFGIYDSLTGGTLLWQETQSVSAVAGRISAELGLVTPFDQSVFSDIDRWLGIQIEADPEIIPRTRLSSVAHAFKVGVLDGAEGGEVTGDVLIDGSVGIGTTSPFQKLHVATSSNNIGVAIEASISGRARLGLLPAGVDNGELGFKNDLMIGTVSDANLVMTSEKVRITNAGNVGIGTPAPASPLEVFYNNNSTTTPAIAINNTTGFQDVLDFKFGGVTQGRVRMANGGGMHIGTVPGLELALVTANTVRMTVSH